jgi:hypothetical protein
VRKLKTEKNVKIGFKPKIEVENCKLTSKLDLVGGWMGGSKN